MFDVGPSFLTLFGAFIVRKTGKTPEDTQ